MESIVSYFSEIGIDLWIFLKIAGMILIGGLLLSAISRFIFKKQTLLSSAISSSIAIIFIYVVMVLLLTVATELRFLVTPLPFASISEETIRFFRFSDAPYTAITGELLSMIILSFLVNLIDGWLPKGKGILKWTWWRIVTIAIGLLLHCCVTWLFNRYLPQGIITYAPVILLGILMLMLLTGALRFILGAILATVNPFIAALYTFFFSTLVGKQITKAVFTTAILSGIVLLLQKQGITALSLLSGALIAYIPFLLVLILVWHVICKL